MQFLKWKVDQLEEPPDIVLNTTHRHSFHKNCNGQHPRVLSLLIRFGCQHQMRPSGIRLDSQAEKNRVRKEMELIHSAEKYAHHSFALNKK